MKLDVPRINKILNIFEPIIFPKAKSVFPFFAETIEVISSGRLVPIAIIVHPIILSLMLNNLASPFELSTTNSPPYFKATIPIIIPKILFKTDIFLVSIVSFFSFFCYFLFEKVFHLELKRKEEY